MRTWLVLKLLEVLPKIHPEVYGKVTTNWEVISHLEALDCGGQRDYKCDGASVYNELPAVNADDAQESARGPAGASSFDDYELADMGSSGVNGRVDTAGAEEIAKRAIAQMARAGGHVTSDTIAETLLNEKPIAWPSSRGNPRPVQWPKTSKDPIREDSLYYLIGAFPLRFMNTHADLNVRRYPFACHPTFRYVALNMTFRHHAWNRAIIFANRQLPAGISVNTIKEQASRLRSYPFHLHRCPHLHHHCARRLHPCHLQCLYRLRSLHPRCDQHHRCQPYHATEQFLRCTVQVAAGNDYTINKIFARAGQMKSTAGYWMAERTKWYNLILYWQHYFKQIPSVFLTVSEPELHDPSLHKLLDQILPAQKRYYGVEPPPANDKLQRKLAVTENLHLVSWFFVQKMRSLHHRILYPQWKMLCGADGRKVTPSKTRMSEYVCGTTGLPRIEVGPVPAVGGHGGRYEFADRRMMTHLHELLMLPNAPDMHQKLAAIHDPKGAEARAIVEWVAESLGLTAFHPIHSKEGWPESEGTLPQQEKSRAGLAALRQRFGDLKSQTERRSSEGAILNYCMRDVKNRAGEVIRQRCRMRADLKAEFCCRCARCMPDAQEWRCEACDDECDANECRGAACQTSVWMLPDTFRFELRVCRRHPRLQVPPRTLALHPHLHLIPPLRHTTQSLPPHQLVVLAVSASTLRPCS